MKNNNNQEEKLLEILRFNLFVQNYNKKAEDNFGVTFVQWFLLKKILDNPVITLQELAKEIGVHPSTLTQNLKRLLKKKLIFISEDTRDKRKKIVSITRIGNEIAQKSLPNLSELINKWESLFPNQSN